MGKELVLSNLVSEFIFDESIINCPYGGVVLEELIIT
jgi:hypothetical protein